MKEAIPPNAPELRGNCVQVSAFIDANNAGNLVTCQSQTGILLFVNKALVMWYSKQQNCQDLVDQIDWMPRHPLE